MPPGLERAQPFDKMYGYDYNRIVDALNNQRQVASVSLAGIVVLGMGYQLVDANFRARFRFLVPTNFTLITKATISFTLQPFHSSTVPTSDSRAAVGEAGMASAVRAFVDGTDRTVTMGGPWGAGSALDVTDADITAFVSASAWHEVQLSSSTAGGITAQIRIQGTINPTL